VFNFYEELDKFSIDDLVKDYRAGNEMAAQRLILKVSKLVKKIVYSFSPINIYDHDDLIQESFCVVLNCAKKYDFKYEQGFIPYLCEAIKTHIRRIHHNFEFQKRRGKTMSLDYLSDRVENDKLFASNKFCKKLNDLSLTKSDTEKSKIINQIILEKIKFSDTESKILKMHLDGWKLKDIAKNISKSRNKSISHVAIHQTLNKRIVPKLLLEFS